ncbi:MAG: RNB domain-containing ribonuclease [Pyrinomonadaceae bacterium]
MPNGTLSPDHRAIARRAMLDAGLDPDISPPALREASTADMDLALAAAGPSIRDARALLWSSIDNSESLDLDQVEYAERLPGGRVRLLIGIADVDALVPKGSAVDRQAFVNTVSVYTPALTFPMLPGRLSHDLTSLLENADRLAVVIDLTVTDAGEVSLREVYRALVRNRAKLTYEEVGGWLEGHTPVPPSVAQVAGLEDQLRLQQETSGRLRARRKKNGALELETVEAVAVVTGEKVIGLEVRKHNPAQDVIESFMIAANTAMAEFLESSGVFSLRRVVSTPERWSRIVEIAESFGARLPATPDSRALSEFMSRRRLADPARYPELSLSVLKMLGSGEYKVEAPGLNQGGHFGLAVNDYTHSTAPNRRYPDLVTQRCVKALIAGGDSPYTKDELEQIAVKCNRMESAARKVERTTRKAAAAALLSGYTGETFDGIVTGVKEKGTFVRLLSPPAEGRIVRGEAGLDVGDKVRVRLLATDPERGFIDFAFVGRV